MTRRLAAVLLAILLALPFAACRRTEDPAARMVEIRDLFLTTTQRFSAEVTADYGTRVFHFTLLFDSAESMIEVLAPAEISGVRIEVTEGGTTLHFDGAMLDTGTLTPDGLTPLAALPVLLREWREGHIVSAHFETLADAPSVVLTTYLSDRVHQMTWFDRETSIPIQAHILSDGFAVITVLFEGGPLFGSS